MSDLRQSVVFKKVRIHFQGIQPSAWEHPADKVALKALQQVPGLDTVIKSIFSITTEKSLRLMALGSSVRVTEKQFARVHQLFEEACQTLDVAEKPELFVAQNPFFNAGAVGLDKPFIVLNSSLVTNLDDEELLGVIGHELAHILSGHVLYKTLLVILVRLSTMAFNIPLTGIALGSIITALKEWDRKSELSADRAGVLVTQNPEKSIHLLMKMAGGGHVEDMDLGEFIKQSQEYQQANSLLDTAHKVMNTIWLSHPVPVIRAVELMNWVREGEYDRILRGFYQEQTGGFQKDMEDAAKAYSKDVTDAFGPMFDQMKQTANKAKDLLGNIFDKQNP
jgi:Zn-dependent protease with chaperone function